MSEHETTAPDVQQKDELTTYLSVAECEALGRLIAVEFRLAREGLLSTSHSFARTEVIVVPHSFAPSLERFRGYAVVHADVDRPLFGLGADAAGPF